MENGLDIVFRKYTFSPDPAMDQHFLNNPDDIREIIALLEVHSEDIIFEVGAGIGTITKNIPQCRKVFAVEIEPETFSILKQEVSAIPYVEPINGDALSYIRTLKFTKIVSSTPFSICEPLLQKLFVLDYEKCILLLPKKFTDNVLSKSTKLGLFADAFLKITRVREILPDSFSPVPKARTMLLMVKKRELPKKGEALKSVAELERFALASLFQQRDKKLKNALRETLCALLGKTKREAGSMVAAMGISTAVLSRHVENLNYNHYLRILSGLRKLTTSPLSGAPSAQN